MVGGRRKYLRNPFAIGGRKGKFNLIPEMKSIKAAATKGAGALLSDLVKSTAYSTLLAKFRPSGPTSVAENTVASLVSGALTGALAGYIGGAKMAADFVEGAYTVTLYKVVADAFARATGGKAKLFGFVSNPFTSVPTMPILPGVKFGTGQAVAETNGVSGIIPEGNVLPLGGIIPEGNVIPLGAYELDPAEMPDRYRSRF